MPYIIELINEMVLQLCIDAINHAAINTNVGHCEHPGEIASQNKTIPQIPYLVLLHFHLSPKG